MKLQPRHVIAAPFIGLSAYLLFSSTSILVRAKSFDWLHLAFTIPMTAILIFVPGTLGVLALNRQWEDFVKIVGFFAALALFVGLSHYTSTLARTANDLIGIDYPLLGASWATGIAVSPFVISIVAYQRFVPLIIRRIYQNAPGVS